MVGYGDTGKKSMARSHTQHTHTSHNTTQHNTQHNMLQTQATQATQASATFLPKYSDSVPAPAPAPAPVPAPAAKSCGKRVRVPAVVRAVRPWQPWHCSKCAKEFPKHRKHKLPGVPGVNGGKGCYVCLHCYREALQHQICVHCDKRRGYHHKCSFAAQLPDTKWINYRERKLCRACIDTTGEIKYFHPNSINQHQLRAHLPYKVLCPVDGCQYKFPDISALNQHLKAHSVAKTYACGICKLTFRFQSGRSEHQKRCHPAVKRQKQAPRYAIAKKQQTRLPSSFEELITQ